MPKRGGERRWDRYGEFRLMAEAEGWVLARRVGRMPVVVTRKDWDKLARSESALQVDAPGTGE